MIMKETDVMPGKSAEESLDPEDWESMRTLGHRILDDMMDYLKSSLGTYYLTRSATTIRVFGAG